MAKRIIQLEFRESGVPNKANLSNLNPQQSVILRNY